MACVTLICKTAFKEELFLKDAKHIWECVVSLSRESCRVLELKHHYLVFESFQSATKKWKSKSNSLKCVWVRNGKQTAASSSEMTHHNESNPDFVGGRSFALPSSDTFGPVSIQAIVTISIHWEEYHRYQVLPLILHPFNSTSMEWQPAVLESNIAWKKHLLQFYAMYLYP